MLSGYTCSGINVASCVFALLNDKILFSEVPAFKVSNVTENEKIVWMADRNDCWVINNGNKNYFRRQILAFTENTGFYEIRHF